MISDKGTSTLTIENVTLEDAGQYVCTSRNALGESHTKTMLHIKRKYSFLSKIVKLIVLLCFFYQGNEITWV